tara:strand:- start:3816 stop:4076 length:261 start_codon:yes stop_codon:yes gene_type:complete
MDLNVILRSGKYAGRTVGSVYKSDKKYITWILENRPEMLKSHGKNKPTYVQQKPYKKHVYVDPPEVSDKDRGVIRPMSPNEAFDLD